MNGASMEPPHSSVSHPPDGSSVTLPSWLSAPSSCSQPGAQRGQPRQRAAGSAPCGADRTSDVCLSGSVTSSLGTNTPLARSQNTLLGSSVDSVQEVDTSVKPSSLILNSRPSSAGSGSRGGRAMLSIDGVAETSRQGGGGGEKEATAPSASAVSMTEACRPGAKNVTGADNSSGLGSSVSTPASSGQKSVPSSEDRWQQCSSSSTLSTASSSLGRQPGAQPAHSQAAGPGRLVFNTLGSPQSSSGGGGAPKSPGVSVAYLGALSSDLMQQIVRSLPLTSQLGEVSRPSMYMLKPGTPVMGSSTAESHPAGAGVAVRRRDSSDVAVVKPRARTSSLLSVSSVLSDLSSGEQTVSSSALVPPLQLPGGSEKGGSKTCTPRSESDAHSVTSGTSLGEQIKMFSERNTSSQGTASSLSSLSVLGATLEEGTEGWRGLSVQGMANCSVVIEKLDLENGMQLVRRAEDEEMDRPKKRKTKKDRNQSLQRRRRFVINSSSEGGEEEEAAVGGEEGLPDVVSDPHQQRASSALLDGVERMEANQGPEEGDLDSTLVDSGRHLSQEAMSEEEVCRSQASSVLTINPSQ